MVPEGATQLRKELLRAEPVVGRVRSHSVVVVKPVSTKVTCVPDAPEAVLIQELVTDTPVEALRQGVLDWLARPNGVVFDAALVSPRVEGLARELRAVITADSPWLAVDLNGLIEHPGHALSWHRHVKLQSNASSREVIQRSKDPHGPAVHE